MSSGCPGRPGWCVSFDRSRTRRSALRPFPSGAKIGDGDAGIDRVHAHADRKHSIGGAPRQVIDFAHGTRARRETIAGRSRSTHSRRTLARRQIARLHASAGTARAGSRPSSCPTSAGRSPSAPLAITPAALTRMSRRPGTTTARRRRCGRARRQKSGRPCTRRSAAGGPDRAVTPAERRRLTPADRHHRSAAAPERLRCGSSDAARRAGDDD